MNTLDDIALDRTDILRNTFRIAFACQEATAAGISPVRIKRLKSCVAMTQKVHDSLLLFQASKHEILKQLGRRKNPAPKTGPTNRTEAHQSLMTLTSQITMQADSYMDMFTGQTPKAVQALKIPGHAGVDKFANDLKALSILYFDNIHAVICQEIALSPETGRKRLIQFNALLTAGATTARYTT